MELTRKERLALRQKKFRRGPMMKRKLAAVLHAHHKKKQEEKPLTRRERQKLIDAERAATPKAIRPEFV